jgi:NitT/TauT family transport system substrate-binding protein
MRTFRSGLFACVALALSLLVAACGEREGASSAPGSASPASPAPLQRIRLQLNWVPEPEFGGIYAAIQDGLYRDAGLDVEVIKGSAQVPSAQLVAQGACETAIVSGDEILTLRRKGGSLTGIFAIFQRNPTGFLMHEANPIRTLEELWRSDSTVALDPGLPFVKILDAKYGGERLKRVPATGALATFLATPAFVQQCFISAEPVEVRLRGVDARVLGLEPVYNPYTAVIAAHGPWLAANRDAATRFVRATSEGWARYQRDPQRYNPGIAAQNPAMSLEAMNVAAEIQRDLVDASPIGHMTQARWDELAQQLHSIGVIADASAAGAFDDLLGAAGPGIPASP